ncbi:MAG: tetratricopeptide repeat protein [Phycisphaerae bacterium]
MKRSRTFLAGLVLVAALLSPQPIAPRSAFGQESDATSSQVSRRRDEPSDSRVARELPEPTPPALDEPHRRFMSGNYPVARRGYEKLISSGEHPVAASVALSRVLAMQGEYNEAIDVLDSVADQAADSTDWHVASARLLHAVGEYDRAVAHAARARDLAAAWAPAILMHGQVLETLGRRDEAIACYETMSDTLAGDAWRRDPRSLVALGRILDRHTVLTGRKASEQAENVLHNYFQKAYQDVRADYWPANIAAAELLLTKHRPKSAAVELDLAEKNNPQLPDVHVVRAAIALREWRFEDLLEQTDKALEINPNHADAHLLRAACWMMWRRFDRVEPACRKVLEVNPNHLEALSLLAAMHTRLDEDEKARPYIEQVERINPSYGGLWNAIGGWLSAARQFDRAEQHFLRAIELEPHLAEPRTNLGLLYMQTGEEDAARDELAEAHARDDYRADVVNYLNLLRDLRDFSTVETENFIVKINGEHDAVLLHQVAEYAEECFAEICGDFDHKPDQKTLIEIFPTHPQFSVRISGRGWIGTVGACTGRVVAMVAPSADRSEFGTYNWATVLRHELTHTVTLSATDNRIPHWFTEACAVWQQPDRMNYEAVRVLVHATRTDSLAPVSELDWKFIRPRRAGDRSLAYAQAEWMLEYVISEYDFSKVSDMLSAFREGLRQAEVFETVLGVTQEQFDKEFASWARRQVIAWGYSADPPPTVEETADEARTKPADPDVRAEHAVALYLEGRLDEAEDEAREALKLDGDHERALSVLAGVLAAGKEYDSALIVARKLELVSRDSRIAPRVLAECYMAQGRWAPAIAALETLKQRKPLAPDSYEQLARIYRQLGLPEKALPNLIELHRRTMTSPEYARQVAEIYLGMDENDKALRFLQQVTHLDPYEVSAYRAMASVHLRARRYDNAVRAVESICELRPGSSEAWTELAMVRYRAAQADEDAERLDAARTAAEKALHLDPDGPAGHVMGLIEQAMER